MLFFKYLFIFCFFSVVGWILELVFRSIVTKRIVNPGFMSGCVLPIYGAGAVILNIICSLFSNIESNYKVILIFFVSIILLTLLEFVCGLILLKVFHVKLWDYSMYKYNYKGFVCLEFALIWGLLSLIFYVFIYNGINSISINFINSSTCLFFLGIFVGIFMVDLFVSIGLLNKLTLYAEIVKDIIDVEMLKLDARSRSTKRKFLNAIYPYISTSKFLKDKMREKK